MLIFTFAWLVCLFQIGIEGEYCVEKKENSTSGSLYHISTLKLRKDKSYLYTDISTSRSGNIISGDTIRGEWFTTGDTLITKGYNVKLVYKEKFFNKIIN